ncbi:unnamed protein product [Pedinophyceae sp. YPF-701]|nr:unnamed protein product [Pedinophyceae sp. YPF-701]
MRLMWEILKEEPGHRLVQSEDHAVSVSFATLEAVGFGFYRGMWVSAAAQDREVDVIHGAGTLGLWGEDFVIHHLAGGIWDSGRLAHKSTNPLAVAQLRFSETSGYILPRVAWMEGDADGTFRGLADDLVNTRPHPCCRRRAAECQT